MNLRMKALTALTLLASTTAFAAGSPQTGTSQPGMTPPSAGVAPATPDVRPPRAAPVRPQGVGPAASVPGTARLVCTPHPKKVKLSRTSSTRSHADTAPEKQARPAPDVMKTAPARPAMNTQMPLNCGSVGGHHRQGAGPRGPKGPGAASQMNRQAPDTQTVPAPKGK